MHGCGFIQGIQPPEIPGGKVPMGTSTANSGPPALLTAVLATSSVMVGGTTMLTMVDLGEATLVLVGGGAVPAAGDPVMAPAKDLPGNAVVGVLGISLIGIKQSGRWHLPALVDVINWAGRLEMVARPRAGLLLLPKSSVVLLLVIVAANEA